MEIAYKVVFIRDKKLISYFTSEQYLVEYEVGKVTFPKLKGSYLFVFKDLHYAKKYLGANINLSVIYKIYKCEVPKLIDALEHESEICSIDDFWADYHLGKVKIKNQGLYPKGTYWADSVKLIEKVESQ